MRISTHHRTVSLREVLARLAAAERARERLYEALSANTETRLELRSQLEEIVDIEHQITHPQEPTHA